MEKNKRKKVAVISIMSYYARQIFDETKTYEFRKSPLRDELLNKKLYVYSAKEDKAIIGYFKVNDILKGNTNEIIEKTGYDKRDDKQEIVDYYGKNNKNCYALQLYDVTEFEEYLTLKDMRSISRDVNMPQYVKYIYENDPLYNVILSWDKAFSLDGDHCENPKIAKKQILQRARTRGVR